MEEERKKIRNKKIRDTRNKEEEVLFCKKDVDVVDFLMLKQRGSLFVPCEIE
jgi:hypothetical protein